MISYGMRVRLRFRSGKYSRKSGKKRYKMKGIKKKRTLIVMGVVILAGVIVLGFVPREAAMWRVGVHNRRLLRNLWLEIDQHVEMHGRAPSNLYELDIWESEFKNLASVSGDFRARIGSVKHVRAEFIYFIPKDLDFAESIPPTILLASPFAGKRMVIYTNSEVEELSEVEFFEKIRAESDLQLPRWTEE